MASRLALELGREIHAERTRRRWTLADLAHRARVSRSMVHGVEAGEPASIEGYSRLAAALGLNPRFTLVPDRAIAAARAVDPVHSAMGEIQAEQFRTHVRTVRLDEPYQHYQFSGRGDLIAFDGPRRALLHIENRTRFPDIQAFAGSFNAKRAYLADDIARRLGLAAGERALASVTHVVVALWTAEVLHVLRLRQATFRAVAPDPIDGFEAWWHGTPPASGVSASCVVFDPLPGERSSRRRWIGLEDAQRAVPRYRDYAAALEALRQAGRA
jgi:transcriptional regulator with XRE-family HTH domain